MARKNDWFNVSVELAFRCMVNDTEDTEPKTYVGLRLLTGEAQYAARKCRAGSYSNVPYNRYIYSPDCDAKRLTVTRETMEAWMKNPGQVKIFPEFPVEFSDTPAKEVKEEDIKQAAKAIQAARTEPFEDYTGEKPVVPDCDIFEVAYIATFPVQKNYYKTRGEVWAPKDMYPDKLHVFLRKWLESNLNYSGDHPLHVSYIKYEKVE